MNASEFFHAWGKKAPSGVFLALLVCLQEGKATFSCFGENP